MAEEISKEKRYEDLVKAVSGGELAMVKFLWDLIERYEVVVGTSDKRMDKYQETINNFIETFEDRRNGKDGRTPTREELIALIKPLLPTPEKGKDGITPTKQQLLDLIEPLIPDPIPGEDGKPGKKGKDGRRGPMPRHEWSGTRIRFEMTPGEWGPWTNIQGSPGVSMPGNVGGFSGLEKVRGQGFLREGVSEIYFGENLTITRTANGVRIDAEDGGGSQAGGLDFETPVGDVDDSNVDFTVSNVPAYIVVNGAQYFEDVHYTRTDLAITLNNPIGTGGFIRSAYGSGVNVENPTGDVDDSNVEFTVSNTPKYVVVNGSQYFDGAGYSYSGGTITLDYAVGTGGFIRSVY